MRSPARGASIGIRAVYREVWSSPDALFYVRLGGSRRQTRSTKPWVTVTFPDAGGQETELRLHQEAVLSRTIAAARDEHQARLDPAPLERFRRALGGNRKIGY